MKRLRERLRPLRTRDHAGHSTTQVGSPENKSGLEGDHTAPDPPRKIELLQTPVKAEDIRKLRNLLSRRYALDLKIWQHRDVAMHNRDLISKTMQEATTILEEINSTVESMDSHALFGSTEEYNLFLQLKGQITAPGKHDWQATPIWVFSNESEDTEIFVEDYTDT